MIKYLNKILKHPLLSGSLVMLIGSNLANFISYLYHLVLGRFLGPSVYGDLASIISLLNLLTAGISFISIVIIKFVSSGKTSEKPQIINWFLKHGIRLSLVYSGIVLISSGLISEFLHVDIEIVAMVPFILALSIVMFLYKSFLQGLIKFKENVIVSNIEMLGRLIISVLLVYLGFGLFGAVAGMLVSILLIVISLTRYFKKKKLIGIAGEFNGGLRVFKYSLPVLVITVSTTSLVSVDVILAKHFLTSYEAGIFSALSNTSKIMFYATAPITAVMFPIVSQRYSRKENYKEVFLMSLGLVSLAVAGMFGIYILFPELVVNVFYGDKFIEGSKYLYIFAIYGGLYAISSILISFYMSIERVKIAYSVLIASIAQILCITLFHSNINQIILSSVFAVGILTINLLLYSSKFLMKR